MDHGRVIAEGTPDELKRETAPDLVELTVADRSRLAEAAAVLERVTGGAGDDRRGHRHGQRGRRGRALARRGAARARRRGHRRSTTSSLRRPTLDEVFLTLTDPTTATDDHEGLRMNALREGWIITQRDLIHWVRQPAMLVFGLLFSVMLLLIFGLLLGGAIDVPGAGRSDYIAFLLPGMFALTMLFGLETTMTAISADTSEGRHRPVPLAADLERRGGARPQRRRSAVLGRHARRR